MFDHFVLYEDKIGYNKLQIVKEVNFTKTFGAIDASTYLVRTKEVRVKEDQVPQRLK